jgi:hypothetical protein
MRICAPSQVAPNNPIEAAAACATSEVYWPPRIISGPMPYLNCIQSGVRVIPPVHSLPFSPSIPVTWSRSFRWMRPKAAAARSATEPFGPTMRSNTVAVCTAA